MVSLLSPLPAGCGMPVDGGVALWLLVAGGAEETEGRVLAMMYDMMSLMTSSRDTLWRAMLSRSLSASRLRKLATW